MDFGQTRKRRHNGQNARRHQQGLRLAKYLLLNIGAESRIRACPGHNQAAGNGNHQCWNDSY